MNEPRRYRFTRAQRLQHKREFEAVYAAKARAESWPLLVQAVPAIGGRSRLGLSIGRRLGNAVRRNRMKRLLRESFRLEQAEFPAAYDVVVSTKPHEELSLDDYRRLLRESIAKLDRLWTKRRQRNEADAPENPRGPASSPEA